MDIYSETVKTSDGVMISLSRGEFLRPRAVIIAPGFFQSKETPTFRRLAESLRKNIDVLAMDFRGHGRSGGRYTFSVKESEDLKSVIEFARIRYARVGVLGFSYGGSIAILEAAAHRNIDSLVCVSSPMGSRDIELEWWHPESWRLGLKGFERGAGARIANPFLKKTDALKVVHGLTPTPVFFIHAKDDPTVRARHSQALYDACLDPKKLLILDRGSHAQEIFRQSPELFLKEVGDWFTETLD